VVKTIGLGFLALIGVFGIGYGLTWLGVIGARPLQKYQTETSAQVYDTSRVYQQGTNSDIARYCEKMRTTSEPSAKKAIAALIRTTAETYNGPLTQDDQDCISESKGI
jgi:hypothetical protein